VTAAAEVSPGTVLVAAQMAEWRRVQIGTLGIEGEASWRKVLSQDPRPTPGELTFLRDALGVPWLSDAMVATPSAVARLCAWAAAGSETYTPERIRARLAFVGDPEIRAIVEKALIERIPPPVVAHVLVNCWVMGTGWSANGWMYHAPPIPGSLPEPLRVLLVSGHSRDPEETASVFGHECGHSLTLAPTDPETAVEPMAKREERSTALTQLAVACGRLPELIEPKARAERWAAGCARAWGFTGAAADGAQCSKNRRASLEREAAALPPFGTGI
jgi:hypothetical protein